MPPIRTLPAYPVGSASVGAWAGYMIGERSIGQAPAGEVVLYEAPDGDVRVDVRLAEETVWLSQAQMVELFERDQSVVSRHVRHVFAEGEVPEEGNMQVLHIASADRPAGEPMKVELDRQAWCGVLRLLRDYLGSHQVKMDNARIIDYAADGSVVGVEFISPRRRTSRSIGASELPDLPVGQDDPTHGSAAGARGGKGSSTATALAATSTALSASSRWATRSQGW